VPITTFILTVALYVTGDVTVDACTVSRDAQVQDEHKPYTVIFWRHVSYLLNCHEARVTIRGSLLFFWGWELVKYTVGYSIVYGTSLSIHNVTVHGITSRNATQFATSVVTVRLKYVLIWPSGFSGALYAGRNGFGRRRVRSSCGCVCEQTESIEIALTLHEPQ